MKKADFPQVFRQNKGEELENIIELKKQQHEDEYQKIEAEAEENSFVKSEFLAKHPNGSFGEYLDVVARYKYLKVSAFFALLGFVFGLVMYLINPDWSGIAFGNVFGSMLLCTIMGYVICFASRWLVGYVYGAILGFIGYPIFKLFHHIAVKKESKRIQGVEDIADCKLEELNERILAEVEEETKRITCEIEEYLSWFSDEVDKTTQKMKNNILVNNIADWANQIFNDIINMSDRSPHVATVREQICLRVFADAVTCESDSLAAPKMYDFEENRCGHLDSPILATAVSTLIATTIKESMCDPVGVILPDTSFDIETESVEDEEHACATVCITYIAKNENYKPVQQW